MQAAFAFPSPWADPSRFPVGLAACARPETDSADSPALPADREDIRLCLQGDGDAYQRLVERYQDRISALLWRFTRDPETHAALVQDAFVEAWTGLAGYRGEAPFLHWLSRIATRVGYRFWKRKARERARPVFSLEDWDQAAAAPPESIDPEEAAALLHRLLAQLPPRDRLVLTLRYLEDRSIRETAEQTGWSQALVKVQAWRAVRKLKKLFTQAEGGKQ